MCFSGGAWKREVVPDHKFDFIDVRDYHTKNFGIRLQYIWIYVLVLKSFLVYISDIYTAITMLSTNRWTSAIYDRCPEEVCPVRVSFEIGKWVFVGCILLSFLLLAYESQKAKKIINSRDISYAFTNVMANNYYSLRSYDHFCFFCQIENSTKKKDDFAFFIFFTFKDWKRLLLADGPRQTINALTLYSFWLANGKGNPFENLSKYYPAGDYMTATLLFTMLFTVIIFMGSLLLLIIAAVLYVPLLCYIQGNLKEYCCHKVDKRIAELIKKKTQQRVARNVALAKKEAAGDFSHLKGKKGDAVAPIPQPTLPNLSADPEDDYDTKTISRRDDESYRGYNGQEYVNGSYGGYYGGASDYPPMPAYNGYGQHNYDSYHQRHDSLVSHDDYGRGPMTGIGGVGGGEGEYGSTATLAYSAAPIAGAHDYHHTGYGGHPGNRDYPADQYDQYGVPYEQQPPYPGPPLQNGRPLENQYDTKGSQPPYGGAQAM